MNEAVVGFTKMECREPLYLSQLIKLLYMADEQAIIAKFSFAMNQIGILSFYIKLQRISQKLFQF